MNSENSTNPAASEPPTSTQNQDPTQVQGVKPAFTYTPPVVPSPKPQADPTISIPASPKTEVLLEADEPKKKIPERFVNIVKIILIIILLAALSFVVYANIYHKSTIKNKLSSLFFLNKPSSTQSRSTNQTFIANNAAGRVILNSSEKLSLDTANWTFEPYWQSEQGFPILLFQSENYKQLFEGDSAAENLMSSGYFSRARIIRGVNLPVSSAEQLNLDIQSDIAQNFYDTSISNNKKVTNGLEDCWRFKSDGLVLVRCFLQLNDGENIIKVDLNTNENNYDTDMADFQKIIESIQIT